MLFASNNQDKINEIKNILKINLSSLNDIDVKVEILETGNTFMENAIIKAKETYKLTKIPTIADDSGLEIEALNNFPGVLTHRFLGPNKTDSERNQEILRLMQDKKNRTCYFTCCIAYFDGINLITSEYRLKGNISTLEHINNGFGFDSIFLYKGKYLSDMTLNEKNEISPRYKALLKLSQNKNFKKIIDLIQ